MSQTNNKVGVLLPLVFRKTFDYRMPDAMRVEPGDYVRVPFGNKSVWGVAWGEAQGGIEEKKIKTIETLCAHLPPMSEAMRKFIDWVGWYTLAPAGQVLKMALSMPDALEPPVVEVAYRLNEEVTSHEARGAAKLTPGRSRIISYLSDNMARTLKEITTHAKVSTAVLREFIKTGALIEIPQSVTCDSRLATRSSPLSPAQQSAAAVIRNKLGQGFSVTVLDGVTGSGKTEVYFDAIEECIKQNRQALVMLPEIALSVQWLGRFEKRFGFAPDVWHSSVTPAKKRKTWRGIAEGSVRVVVGARSALFLPFAKLALITVDEEHDASYKQEEGVIYQARDMAVVRARHEKIPILLVSATPSLETEFNLAHKRYERVHLPLRHNDACLPAVRLIDMRKLTLAHNKWVSEPLRTALVNTLADKNQAMVFMNRRGYAPLMLCRTCGYRCQCPHCSTYMVLHRTKGKLLCHHCGHNVTTPKQCPECKAENSLIPYGPGVERVAEELRELFPEARIAMMTSDSGVVSGDSRLATHYPADIISAMLNREIDILVGTQMIAKGHHFAGLALVGVIDADMGLAGGDLRAGERTYQLLHQLSGRAGREKTKGEIVLQTYMPEHPVMQALLAGDRDCFMQLEASLREEAGMPPYGKLASLVIEGGNEQEVMGFARELVKMASDKFVMGGTLPPSELRSDSPAGASHSAPSRPPTKTPLILGPAPAPLLRLKNKYRYRILIKAERNFPMQQFLSDWLLMQKIPAALKVKADVEPYSFV